MRMKKVTVRSALSMITFWFAVACGAIALLAVQSCISPEPYPTVGDAK